MAVAGGQHKLVVADRLDGEEIHPVARFRHTRRAATETADAIHPEAGRYRVADAEGPFQSGERVRHDAVPDLSRAKGAGQGDTLARVIGQPVTRGDKGGGMRASAVFGMPQRGVRGKAARRFAFCRSDAQIAGMTRRHAPVRAPIRRLARLALALLLLVSLGGGFLSLRALARDPALHLLVESGAEEYRAAVDAALARRATEGRVAGLLSGYLADSPRDWVALRAVERVAAERGLPLHPTLVGRIEAAWAEDTAPLRLAAGCAACAWDMGNCSLSQGVICNAPVTLSPVGDMLGLARQSGNWWAGAEVDRLDLA